MLIDQVQLIVSSSVNIRFSYIGTIFKIYFPILVNFSKITEQTFIPRNKIILWINSTIGEQTLVFELEIHGEVNVLICLSHTFISPMCRIGKVIYIILK